MPCCSNHAADFADVRVVDLDFGVVSACDAVHEIRMSLRRGRMVSRVARRAFGLIFQNMSKIAMPSMANDDIWIMRSPNVSSAQRRISEGWASSRRRLISASSSSENRSEDALSYDFGFNALRDGYLVFDDGQLVFLRLDEFVGEIWAKKDPCRV